MCVCVYVCMCIKGVTKKVKDTVIQQQYFDTEQLYTLAAMGKKRKESDSSEVTTLVKLSSACACLSLGIDDIQEDPVPAKKKKEKKQKTEDLSPKTNTVLKDSVNEGWQCHWKWHASRTSNGMFDDQQDSAEKKHKEKKHEKAVPLVHHRISFQSAQHPKSVCVCFPFRPTQVAELIKCVCVYIYIYVCTHIYIAVSADLLRVCASELLSALIL